MAGFDDPGIFFSDNLNADDAQQNDEHQVNRLHIKNRFREFLRQFFEGSHNYKYRDQLKKNYNLRKYFLEVDLDDLAHYDSKLSELLYNNPSENLSLFEDAAKEVADEVTKQRPEGEEEVKDIQITLTSSAVPSSVRDLKSNQMSRLVKIPGIIIAASSARAKATRISIQCRSCRNFLNNIPVKPGLEGYALPRKCPTDQAGRVKCPVDPFFIVPEKCKCVDFQVLKLQEAPEAVPNGELPRHLQLYCDRYLCESVVPGNRVSVIGIYSIRKSGAPGKKGSREKINVGVKLPYLRVLGIKVNTTGPGRMGFGGGLSTTDENEFINLAATPNIYDKIANSIAPQIFECTEMKKAIACMLFGGSRKKLPDGIVRRGDINLLLLGDPGTAKSQLLKFVETCAPIGVYTSGKGSSAAGLTASVIRDPSSRNFVIEGGAMVLADGGVVCIDEFDKMREDDRVAIHEAMEQQTISIAKAGITTTLNSRCSVLAAANGIYGRWDDSKGAENIDFMPTILSRFDMIFIVKDVHDEARDMTIARHVMNLHCNAQQATEAVNPAEIRLETLRKFITFARSQCGPRLSKEAAEKLKNRYVLMRNGALDYERETGQKTAIPITVRQLEAVVRISESLAKMRLAPFATEEDVDEALRLFQVSTLEAALSGQLSGAEGFATEEDQEILNRIEKQLKRRFVVGSQVSEHAIVQDFVKQNYPERSVTKVIRLMLRREELQYRMQRKMLYRVK